ncbi:hypothetical protein [Paenirhodobacter populi]|uniref:Uncharacterized protein n=1 Tax=Paenirhodobacter populi TaxID=2306993 RepID=A0A443KNU4_9RHOB|nr:hypothetical protein [Sinirhodobacter populi]RWR07076.1 hypothetical protein D2T32_12400 [Sinirhodobacter populi]RWR34531.1 hypothetical protein D2T29_03015 [Sinirhodobacter populi]
MTRQDAPAGNDEKRALNKDELALADQARQPGLGALSDRALSDLVALLRERRNRARDIGDRQGREARGKAGPAGTAPAAGNIGMRSKLDFLNEALDRAVAERDRRGSADDEDQADLARKALALKEQGQAASPMLEEGGPLHPQDPEADRGKASLAGTARRTAPSGALDHAGELPARERSRERG